MGSSVSLCLVSTEQESAPPSTTHGLTPGKELAKNATNTSSANTVQKACFAVWGKEDPSKETEVRRRLKGRKYLHKVEAIHYDQSRSVQLKAQYDRFER